MTELQATIIESTNTQEKYSLNINSKSKNHLFLEINKKMISIEWFCFFK